MFGLLSLKCVRVCTGWPQKDNKLASKRILVLLLGEETRTLLTVL